MPVFCGFALLNYLVHEAVRMAATSGAAALLTLLSLVALRVCSRTAFASGLFVLAFVTQIFGEMALNGGLSAAATPLTALIVPAAILLSGLSAGRVWFLVTLIAIIAISALDHAGRLPPSELTSSALVIDRALSLTAGVVVAALVVAAFARQARDSLAALQAERSRFQHEATHDALTGLPNRTLFMQRAAEHLTAAGREGRRCGLFYLDLDRFKQVNDRYGHEAGDRLLMSFADRIRQRLRPGDFAARLAGDEFVLFAADCGPGDAVERIAARLHAASDEPFDLGGTEVSASASIGHAVFPDHAGDLAALLRIADRSMYRVKASARAGAPLHRVSPKPARTQTLSL